MQYDLFESGVVSNDWGSTVIVPLLKGKGERGLNVRIINAFAC